MDKTETQRCKLPSVSFGQELRSFGKTLPNLLKTTINFKAITVRDLF